MRQCGRGNGWCGLAGYVHLLRGCSGSTCPAPPQLHPRLQTSCVHPPRAPGWHTLSAQKVGRSPARAEGGVRESCLGNSIRKESVFPIRDQGATVQEERSQAKLWTKIGLEDTCLTFLFN